MAKRKGAEKKAQAPKGTKRKAPKPSSPPPRQKKASKTEQDTEEAEPARTKLQEIAAQLTSDELVELRFGGKGSGFFPFNPWTIKEPQWPFLEDKELRKRLNNECSISHWTHHYGVKSVKELNHLSDGQKNKIITSLDGWCVQIPWNSLVRRFPFSVRKKVTDYLLRALVNKDIVTKMYYNPFWYLDGKKGPDDEEGDETFGPRLKYLMDRFLETNPAETSLWRSDTSHLANATQPFQARSLAFGLYHEERRERMVQQWAADFIASEPVCWLLRPHPRLSNEDMHRDLTKIYRNAAEGWVRVCHSPGNFAIMRLPDLGKKFDKESKLMQRSWDHLTVHLDESVDGMPILLVVIAGVRMQWRDPELKERFHETSPAAVLAQEKTTHP